VRFAVESWAAEYGSPVEGLVPPEEENSTVEAGVEVPAGKWEPLTPSVAPGGRVVFIDGVQQVDARIWTEEDEGVRMGLCVSVAAGAVCCDDSATIGDVRLRRYAVGPASLGAIDCPDGVYYESAAVADLTQRGLDNQVNNRREALEVMVAQEAGEFDFTVVDGHLRQREAIPRAVGYVKTHHAQYLDPPEAAVIGRLRPGQRTPVFLLETAWSRYTWYLKLPGSQAHAWAGVVRCEVSNSLRPAEAAQFADYVSATLPRFASEEHKDPRAPQNLYPIAGLERELRRRLGDRMLLLRRLRRAAALSA
jgi:hypothetical protein